MVTGAGLPGERIPWHCRLSSVPGKSAAREVASERSGRCGPPQETEAQWGWEGRAGLLRRGPRGTSGDLGESCSVPHGAFCQNVSCDSRLRLAFSFYSSPFSALHSSSFSSLQTVDSLSRHLLSPTMCQAPCQGPGLYH